MLHLLWLIPIAVAVFLAVILIRAAGFKPREEREEPPTPADVDEARAVESLQKMIQCRTVSYFDASKIDEREFDAFRALLEQRYPRVHAACTRERIGRSGLLYSLKGKSSDNPGVLMAHYDVVPVDESGWDKPPFAGILEDGVLWGRGALDTKVTLNGVMEAAEHLLGGGFTPENDLYFAFAGDEEVAGTAQVEIVQTLKARGIVPAIVVDEGGAVVENIFPGVKEPCALIGIGEKGMLNMTMTVEGAGGHASSPPPHTGVGILAKAVTRIEDRPFPNTLTKPVAEMFDTLGRRSTFVYRLIFANLWCFMPVLDALCRKSGGELNAMMRTTCAFTQMEGSPATNVLAPKAMIGANLRIIGGETPDTAMRYLEQAANNPAIRFKNEYSMTPSPFSRTEGYGWERVKSAVRRTWPDAIVSPYLMVACSDSRHYNAISENVYRFSAMALSKEERGCIHGHNERVPVGTVVRTVQFYVRLIESL